jgi:hypothetical protein
MHPPRAPPADVGPGFAAPRRTMETQESRTVEGAPPQPRERGPGVVELVREKIEELAAEAEWTLGSEEGLEHEWVEGETVEEDDEGEGEGFFESVAHAIEQTLWSDDRDEAPDRPPPPPGRA